MGKTRMTSILSVVIFGLFGVSVLFETGSPSAGQSGLELEILVSASQLLRLQVWNISCPARILSSAKTFPHHSLPEEG